MATIRINQLPAGDANLDDHLPRENTSDVDAKITIQQIVDLAPQGDVVGPPVAIDNEVLVSDGTTGKLLKQSGFIVNTATPVFFSTTIPYFGSDGNGLTVEANGYLGFDDVSKSLFSGSGAQNASGTGCVALGGSTNNTTGSPSASLASFNGIASGNYAVAIGADTYNATGNYSLVSGLSSEAKADHAKAIGRRAKSLHSGSLVLSDSQNADYSSSTTDQFSARFSGGYRLQSGPLQFNGASVVADGNLANSEINWSVVGDNVQGKYKNSGGSVFTFTLPSSGSSSYVKITSQSVLGPTTNVDFNNLSAIYSKYIIEIREMTSTGAGNSLGVRFSTDNGATFLSGSTDYIYTTSSVSQTAGATVTTFSGLGADLLSISQDLNTAGQGNSFTVSLINTMSASYATEIISDGFQLFAVSSEGRVVAGGRRNAVEANNAIRFTMSSGQIATGVFTLYGVVA